MEDILDVYEMPYDQKYPVICVWMRNLTSCLEKQKNHGPCDQGIHKRRIRSMFGKEHAASSSLRSHWRDGGMSLPGNSAGQPPGNPPYADPWELAEHCKNRVERNDPPMPGPQDRYPGKPEQGVGRMGTGAQCANQNGRLAF